MIEALNKTLVNSYNNWIIFFSLESTQSPKRLHTLDYGYLINQFCMLLVVQLTDENSGLHIQCSQTQLFEYHPHSPRFRITAFLNMLSHAISPPI